MIIKLQKIISCTSEHPSYPAANLLHYRLNRSWRCAKPGELLASVTIQLAEPSCITGLDIANYRSCIVVLTAATSAEPDKWLPIVNYQFMTHDEASEGRFRDQVQLFTKKELNSETLKTKFDRVKICCMQSANLKELFGLAFLVLRTEVTLDLGQDVLKRFKLRPEEEPTLESFKQERMKLLAKKQPSYRESLADKIKEVGADNFEKRQQEDKERKKGPLLTKIEADETGERETDRKDSVYAKLSRSVERKADDTPSSSATAATPVRRTPFGDVVTPDTNKKDVKDEKKTGRACFSTKKRFIDYVDSSEDEETAGENKRACSVCAEQQEDRICENCRKLPPPRKLDNAPPPSKKPKVERSTKKPFAQLFQDITFSLSGYVNPQRDEIRRKALKMGGKYIVDPNTSNNKCTHLVCAFKNTPKSQQLKGHCKIVSHAFIEECYDKKKRLPWRRFALTAKERSEPESEDEIEGSTSPVRPPNPYEQDTDSDSNY